MILCQNHPEILGGNLNTPRAFVIKRNFNNIGGEVLGESPLANREITFLDFRVVQPLESLESAAKSLFPKGSKLQKIKSFDVNKKSWAYFKEHKKECLEYCEADVLVLGGLVLKTLQNLNTLILDIANSSEHLI